jgi:hypothetical protein
MVVEVIMDLFYRQDKDYAGCMLQIRVCGIVLVIMECFTGPQVHFGFGTRISVIRTVLVPVIVIMEFSSAVGIQFQKSHVHQTLLQLFIVTVFLIVSFAFSITKGMV